MIDGLEKALSMTRHLRKKERRPGSYVSKTGGVGG
jgi:hypothetical protein